MQKNNQQPKSHLNNILQAALRYREREYSVIPIKRDKKPYISWEKFQKRLPTTEDIRGWWHKWPSANVGIVTGKISGLVVIDIDAPEGLEAIQEYVPDSLLMPCARTPSGGQHMYFMAPDSCPGNNARLVPGCDFRGEGGYIIAPPSRNGGGKGYVWQEGLSLDEVEPPPLPSEYLKYLLSTNAFTYKETVDKFDGNAAEMFMQGRRDEDLFHVANCLVKGNMLRKEIEQVIEILAKSCDPPFPPKDIQIKIESALKRAERRERNLSQEVREWVLSTNGVFLSSEVVSCLQLSTREEQKNLSIILRRLCDEGILERYGHRNGCFRRIEQELEKMDFLNAETGAVDIRLPFDIHERVDIMPGNIILVAGEINSGKTAFCLNTIKENMHRFEIHYFNSEMGGGELKKRLLKFDDVQLKDWKFKAWERTDTFADVIAQGEGKINVIDFLEIHDNFYEIGGRIAEIHKKLKGAVAIVALQKNKGVDVGLGGYRSLEKPRLALAMSSGVIKIVKAKNWKSNENPNGLVTEFKIIGGCKLYQNGFWHRES